MRAIRKIWMIFWEVCSATCLEDMAESGEHPEPVEEVRRAADFMAVLAAAASGGGYQSRGQDITSDLTVTFDEAAFGCDKMITLTSSDGRKQTLQLHIPAGMEDGKSLRLQGKGGAGVNGAPAGDLLICIHVAEKPGFTRKGADVYTTANIPFTTAVLGGEAIINTLNGRVSCRIKPGTQSGSKIRLKGKGVANMRDPKTFGDLYVTVQIEVPTSLSAEALAKLREFEAASDRKKGGFHAA